MPVLGPKPDGNWGAKVACWQTFTLRYQPFAVSHWQIVRSVKQLWQPADWHGLARKEPKRSTPIPGANSVVSWQRLFGFVVTL